MSREVWSALSTDPAGAADDRRSPSPLAARPRAGREHLRRRPAALGDRRRLDRPGRRRWWPWSGPTSTSPPTPPSAHWDIGPLDVEHWAADGALAIFFFVAGLELKRELLVGSLRRPADAAVPVVAACCGVAVPALIFVVVNRGTDNLGGWAIPAATDIAFALAILAVVGSALPDAAARLPADAGRGRRPDRHRGDRGLLHLDDPPRPGCWWPRAAFAAYAVLPAAARPHQPASTCPSP